MKRQFTMRKIATITLAGFVLLTCGCKSPTTQANSYKIASQPSTLDNVQMRSSRTFRSQAHAVQPSSSNSGYHFAKYDSSVMSQTRAVSDPAVYGTIVHDRPTNDIITREYHIGTGDVLLLKIDQLLEPDKETVLKVEVDRNGLIYLPILNHITVGGMTVDDVQKALLSTLASHYIKNPRVDVSVDSFESKKVLVLGEVKKPGPVSLKYDSVPVLEAINEAGGLTSNVSPYVEIMRGAYKNFSNLGSSDNSVEYRNYRSNQYQRELVPLARVLGEGNLDQINPVVRPGDVVRILPISEGYVYFSGEFMQRGSRQYRRPFTLMQALAVAGGPTNIAKIKDCRILRRNSDGTEREIHINVDKVIKGENENIMLACNDTLIMPVDPWKKFWSDFFGLFTGGVRVGVDTTYDAAEGMGWPGSDRYTYEHR